MLLVGVGIFVLRLGRKHNEVWTVMPLGMTLTSGRKPCGQNLRAASGCRMTRPQAARKGPAEAGQIRGGLGGHAAPPWLSAKTQRIRSSGLFPGRAAGVFLVYEGVHPFARLLE